MSSNFDKMKEIALLIDECNKKEKEVLAAEEAFTQAKDKLKKRASELSVQFSSNHFFYNGKVYKINAGDISVIENVTDLNETKEKNNEIKHVL